MYEIVSRLVGEMDVSKLLNFIVWEPAAQSTDRMG